MIQGINHITLAVLDIETSFKFYHEALGFKPLCKWEGSAYFLAGNLWFCLDQDETPTERLCSTHYAFSVEDADFDTIRSRIIAAGTRLYKENTSPGKSLYFMDPDDHKLEIHVGTWQNRIAFKKHTPGNWHNIEWFV